MDAHAEEERAQRVALLLARGRREAVGSGAAPGARCSVQEQRGVLHVELRRQVQQLWAVQPDLLQELEAVLRVEGVAHVRVHDDVAPVELQVQVDVVDDVLGAVLGEAALLETGGVAGATEALLSLDADELLRGAPGHAALHIAHADRAVPAGALGERDGDARAPELAQRSVQVARYERAVGPRRQACQRLGDAFALVVDAKALPVLRAPAKRPRCSEAGRRVECPRHVLLSQPQGLRFLIGEPRGHGGVFLLRQAAVLGMHESHDGYRLRSIRNHVAHLNQRGHAPATLPTTN